MANKRKTASSGCGFPADAQAYFDRTVETMRKMGTYRPEFDNVIWVYAKTCEEYDIVRDRLKRSGFRVQTASAQGGMKKSPLIAVLEKCRMDILAYSDRLCLNPKACDAVDIKRPEEPTKLDRAFEVMLNG